MTINDYLHAFQSRLTYVSEKEQTKIKQDIRSEIEQIKENILEHEKLNEKEAEHQAVASYLSPADMANEINEQYFESIDEQFSGRTIAFSVVLSSIFTPLGILFVPFIIGIDDIISILVPYGTFALIGVLILSFYFPKKMTAGQLRTLRHQILLLPAVPLFMMIAYFMNALRPDGIRTDLTVYLFACLFIWLMIYLGTRVFYKRQLRHPV